VEGKKKGWLVLGGFPRGWGQGGGGGKGGARSKVHKEKKFARGGISMEARRIGGGQMIKKKKGKWGTLGIGGVTALNRKRNKK